MLLRLIAEFASPLFRDIRAPVFPASPLPVRPSPWLPTYSCRVRARLRWSLCFNNLAGGFGGKHPARMGSL